MSDFSSPRDDDYEAKRLLALHRYRLLDTPPEDIYDDITRLAAQVCDTPIALISLIDEDRQWFKSRVGLEATETPRSIAFCDHAIRGDILFTVEDALEDTRFANNPLVTASPNVRFYSGMPLTTDDGLNLGTLCVIDQKPRELSEKQKLGLTALARQLVLQFELKRVLAEERHLREELDVEIEERTNVEIKERRAKQFLRGTIDALTDHIAIIDAQGQVIDVNSAWVEFAENNVGKGSLAALERGANYLEVCRRAVADGATEVVQIIDALRGILSGESDAVFEFEYPCHAPAEKRWFVLRISPLSDGEGRYAVLAHQNITARYLAEEGVRKLNLSLEDRVAQRGRQLEQAFESLRQSEAKFGSMFKGALVGLIIVDKDGLLEESNRAFDEIIGAKPGEYIGKPLVNLNDESRMAEAEAKREAFRNGDLNAFREETPLRRIDGDTVWVKASPVPIQDGAGDSSRTLVVVQNVTERHVAEYERDQFFEQSADMFGIIGFDGVIHRVNRASSRVLDYQPEELNGTPYIDLVDEQQRPRMLEIYEGLIAGTIKDMPHLDLLMKLKSGGRRVVRWSVAIWRAESRIVAVGRDMTETLEKQEALQALTARLHQIRDDERSSISREIHDHLGQMLTALKMDLTLLQRDIGLIDGAEAKLLPEINSMIGLTDDTLQAVRRIAQELRPEILDALGLVPAIEWQANEICRRAQLDCEVVIADGVPEVDGAKTTQIFRILQEALTNVVRHARASRVQVKVASRDGSLVLTISDNGCGFVKSRQHGFSLGTLGMQERAQASGATLDIDSAPGKGTTVTVTLTAAANSNGVATWSI